MLKTMPNHWKIKFHIRNNQNSDIDKSLFATYLIIQTFTHSALEEKRMIKLSENAKKELDAFFATKEKSTIRVFLAPGG